jgi:hypothetical protein
MQPSPAVHPDLAALVALAVADKQRTAIGVPIGLVERERLADSKPSAPKHDDHAAQAEALGSLAGGAHHRDDLLHGRRIGRIPQALVARRHPAVEAGRGRRRPATAGPIQQRYRFHGVLLWTMVDPTDPPAPMARRDEPGLPTEALASLHNRLLVSSAPDVAGGLVPRERTTR